MPEESLKSKTVRGTIWSGIDNLVQYGVKFLVGIVLARILSPDDYGLVGIVAIFTVICETLIDGGFYTSLIRKKDATDDDYNTVFIVNLVVAVVLYGMLFSLAPYIADFFERRNLTSLVQVASLTIIIGAFSLVQRARLTKRIDFKSQTKVTLSASVISGVVGIGMALTDFGVWALVAQSIIGRILRTTLLTFYNRWLPRLRFSQASFHELFGFGWKMMLSSLLNTLWGQLSQMVVGKFYSPAMLGQYTRSSQFAQLFSSNLTNVVQRVTYPVLSSIQDDRERMVSAYRRIIKISIFVSATGMFFVGAVAEPLLYCLIGPKWHEAAVFLPLICIDGSAYPLHAINLNMLQVLGRSNLFLGLEIFKKFIALLPLAVGALVGILPMLYVCLLVSVISFVLNSYYSGRLLGYSSWMQVKDVAPSYGIALLTAVSVYFLKYLPLSYWIILPCQMVVGLLVFLGICRIIRIAEYEEIYTIVKPIFTKIRSFSIRND